MKNTDIIAQEAIANGIFTADEIATMIMSEIEIPLHTFAGWKSRGFVVKRGEHAKITTGLWKYTSRKEVNDDDEEIEVGKCRMVKAFLFTHDQVTPIAQRA